MKVICLLTIFALAVNAIPIENGHIHGENGWYVPQLNGSFVWMGIKEAETLLNNLRGDARDITLTPVTFYLYTSSNPTKGTKIEATTKSINDSKFNPANPTRFITHGWTHSYTAKIIKNVRKAWLNQGDYNVIVVDWARARGEYALAVAAVPTVGAKIAGLIDFLVTRFHMSLNTLQVAGHSLGAHVSGFAGKNVQSGKINTIIGLDPALPLFNYNLPTQRLAATDGVYVESIQTNGGELGFLKPIGKGAFYPNGGKSQPGCGLDLAGICAHERSVLFFIETIERDNFPTIECSDYQEAVAKSCGAQYSTIRMGALTNDIMVLGDYFVPVNKKSPYGMGEL